MIYNGQIYFVLPMRIKVQSQMRKLFGRMDPDLQKILLADLGFLTLASEAKQLEYVQRILAMNRYEVRKLKTALSAWHKSAEYRELLKRFDKEFREIVVPTVNKAKSKAHAKDEAREKELADEMIDDTLSKLDA